MGLQLVWKWSKTKLGHTLWLSEIFLYRVPRSYTTNRHARVDVRGARPIPRGIYYSTPPEVGSADDIM